MEVQSSLTEKQFQLNSLEMEIRALKELQAHKVFKVFREHLYKVLRGYKVYKVFKASLYKVFKVFREPLVFKV
ncbi:MAG: hypothetical protein EBT15_11470 [Betaproteobacteria bacterium]|nr:hypothetical protein [Betaproteobacteria bacterium]